MGEEFLLFDIYLDDSPVKTRSYIKYNTGFCGRCGSVFIVNVYVVVICSERGYKKLFDVMCPRSSKLSGHSIKVQNDLPV